VVALGDEDLERRLEQLGPAGSAGETAATRDALAVGGRAGRGTGHALPPRFSVSFSVSPTSRMTDASLLRRGRDPQAGGPRHERQARCGEENSEESEPGYTG
jgi:hypothetical protein